MQITLNQQDILKAVHVYLESLMKKPIDVVNLDIKGMRTVEGYTATVDVLLDGEVVQSTPKPVNAVQPVLDPKDGVVPDGLTEEEAEEWAYIANLLAHNPRGINDSEIVVYVENAFDAVFKKAQENELYQSAYARYYGSSKTKSEEQPEDKSEGFSLEGEIVITTDGITTTTIEEAVEAEAEKTEEEIPPVDEYIKPDEQEEMVQVQVGTNILGQPIYELKPKSQVNGLEVKQETQSEVQKGMFS